MIHSSDDKSVIKMLLCESVSFAQVAARRGFFSRPIFLSIFGMRVMVYRTQGCPLRSPITPEGILVTRSLFSNDIS